MRNLVRLSLAATAAILVLAAPAAARVLRVGSYHGVKGQYKSIKAAITAAKPGDWILIGPGDYKTHSSSLPKTHHPANPTPAAYLITTPKLRIRGMNRNKVIVDGTKSGPACSRKKADQSFGPKVRGGPGGLNGLLVWHTDNVWIQNLTSCNFLGGNGSAGNQIWWNGGDDTGGAKKVRIGGWGYLGTYLTATSTFFDTAVSSDKAEHEAAEYGIFSSNWNGGVWDHTYTSNFNDSGYYIGACGQQCNQVVNHAWGEFSALGYSGSNSGGSLIVKNSEFDHNQDGFDTNSQNGDNPPPQNGACPKGKKPPVKGAAGCWVFMDNYVHDNNNPNVPGAGFAGGSPVGTGMSLSGGRFDTVIHNRFVNNKAWGVIVIPFLDSGPPCTGGTLNSISKGSCLYDDYGDAVLNNTFAHNGGYGKPTNGDIAWLNFEKGHPTPCFRGNVAKGGGSATTSPSDLEKSHPMCDGTKIPADTNGPFLTQILCNTGVSLGSGPPSCPNGKYPQQKRIVMHSLPSHLATMPDPCRGVPVNPWCPSKRGFTG